MNLMLHMAIQNVYICMFHMLTSYVESVHEEPCRKAVTRLYVRSANKQETQRYKVYPGGIIWTIESDRDDDNLEIFFGTLKIPEREYIRAYEGRDKNGKLLLTVDKFDEKLKRPPEVSEVRPSVFVNYNWSGGGASFHVQCKSVPSRWRTIGYEMLALVIIGGTIGGGFLIYMFCCYICKDIRHCTRTLRTQREETLPERTVRTRCERSSIELHENVPSADTPHDEEELQNSRASTPAPSIDTDADDHDSQHLPSIHESMPTPAIEPPSYSDVVERGERYYPRTGNLESSMEEETLLPPYPGLPSTDNPSEHAPSGRFQRH